MDATRYLTRSSGRTNRPRSGLGLSAGLMLPFVRPEKQPKMAVKSTKGTLWCLVLAIATGISALSAWALGNEPRSGETVTQYLTPEILEAIFPGADKVGEVGEIPPA